MEKLTLTEFVKRYWMWVGAVSVTFTAMHWLRLDGPIYWDFMVEAFGFMLTLVTSLAALII